MRLTIFWRALQLAGVRASTNTGLAAFNKMEEKVLALEAEVEAAEQVSISGEGLLLPATLDILSWDGSDRPQGMGGLDIRDMEHGSCAAFQAMHTA